MNRPKNIENLLKIHVLKEAERDQLSIEQFVAAAQEYFNDCPRVASDRARFLIAYEGFHSLAMAVLNHYGTRAGDGEGHRIQALQLAVHEIGMEKSMPGTLKTVTDLHLTRNEKTYKQPIPPVTKAEADAAVAILGAAIGSTRRLVGLASGARQ